MFRLIDSKRKSGVESKLRRDRNLGIGPYVFLLFLLPGKVF